MHLKEQNHLNLEMYTDFNITHKIGVNILKIKKEFRELALRNNILIVISISSVALQEISVSVKPI